MNSHYSSDNYQLSKLTNKSGSFFSIFQRLLLQNKAPPTYKKMNWILKYGSYLRMFPPAH